MDTITYSAALGQAISLHQGTAMPTLSPVEAVNLWAHIIAPEFLGSLKENGQDTGVWGVVFLGVWRIKQTNEGVLAWG